MGQYQVIIADGHHRYKTALALQKENPDLETARYRMLTFVIAVGLASTRNWT